MLSLKYCRSRLLTLLLLPFLAGCTLAVGPSYHPVQVQVPSSFPAVAQSLSVPPATPADAKPAPTQPGAAIPVSLPPAENLTDWWVVFNDPTLTKLVAESMEGNLDLKQACLRIYQARASRGIIVSGLFPQLDYTGSANTSRTPVLGHGGRGFIGRTSNFFTHGLDAAWELDFFGGTRRAVESADASIEAAVEDRRDAMVTLAAEIGTNYIALRGFQKELVIARENVVSQQKSVDLTEKKQKAGISNALDVANAKALVASTRAQIPVLETAAQEAIYALGVLLGRDPNALDEELNKGGPIPPPPPSIPVGLPSDLLQRRPDIRAAQARVHAATAQIGVAKADLFPKFSLTGSAGFQGQKQSALVSWAQRAYSFGPSVDWSIFSAGKVQCNIVLQRLLEAASEVTYRQSVLTALQDVDSAAYAYAKEKEHRDILADEVKQFQRVVELSLDLYQKGATDFLNVIIAQRSLYQAQDELVQSERALSLDIVALYKALGGGWNDADVIECDPCVH
ncbi:MAG TPA: efflux transporter outer membrane subunit [Planctomycetota bacterium]|nr:efflux transporter outer membrane subunit [Planctomycetota bacterium]